MKSLPYDTIPYLVLFAASGFIMVTAVSQNLNDYHQNKISRLQDAKFNFHDYADNYDNEEKDKEVQASQWDQIPPMNYNNRLLENNQHSTTDVPVQLSDNLQNQNISWVPNWASDVKFGQISGVTVDPRGNIAVFHRGDHVWAFQSFDKNNRYVDNTGAIQQNTIILLDKTGKVILQWGRNMFYLPHGLTIDHEGNYWITDVALHQVFKFSAMDLQTHLKELKEASFDETNTHSNLRNDDSTDLFKNSIIKPALTLGQAFKPGNDHTHFCKPTAVAVRKNGDFFVSDGYCNSRIVKFDKDGKLIAEWGRHWTDTDSAYAPPPHNAFWVPHGLSLADELDFLYLADRENGRVLCFFASNGTFHKEYQHPTIGSKIYSVAYNQEKIYLINGPNPLQPDFHIRGFVIDIHSGNILSQFQPHEDMTRPHDIAITPDGTEIYVVELDIHKVYKFIQRVNGYTKLGNSTMYSGSDHQPVSLTDINSKDINSTTENTTTAVLVLSLITTIVIFIALCLSIAAIIARCQKRGRMKDYDEASVEFTKLVE